MRYKLSPEALQDYAEILLYTATEWDESLVARYEQDLFDALNRLVSFPLLGKSSPQFGSEIRAMRFNQHLIIYRLREDVIEVTRIVHMRRGPDIYHDE